MEFLRGPHGRFMPTAYSSAEKSLPTSSSFHCKRSSACVFMKVPQATQQSSLHGPFLPQQSFRWFPGFLHSLGSLRPRKKMDMEVWFVYALEVGSGRFAGISGVLVTQSMIQEKRAWACHPAGSCFVMREAARGDTEQDPLKCRPLVQV